MSHRISKRFQILLLTALLIVTTGIAAAPVGMGWSPIFARPFGQWLGRSSAVVTTHQEHSSKSLERSPEAALQPLGGPAGYPIPPVGLITSESRAGLDDQVSALASVGAASQRGDDFSGDRRGGYSNGLSGSSRAAIGGGNGRASATAVVSTNGRYESTSRAETRGTASTTQPARSSGGTAPGKSDGGASKNPEKPKDPGGLFGEHKKGLEQLNGAKPGKNLPHDSGSVGGGNVAVNPEPSTFFLLGTGLVAAAGAVRRRLR